jgi:hypothetical protein
MESQVLSLACILGGHAGETIKPLHGKPTNMQTWQFSTKSLPLHFARWDKLGDISGATPREKASFREGMTMQPDIVVISTGSHYSAVKYGSSLRAVSKYKKFIPSFLLQMCKRLKSSTVVFWRPTHVPMFTSELLSPKNGCIKVDSPVADANAINRKNLLHVRRLNILFNKFAKESGCKRFFMLDTLDMSVQRPDAVCRSKIMNPRALDCGHYCLPGVPDWWNYELIRMMIRAGVEKV